MWAPCRASGLWLSPSTCLCPSVCLSLPSRQQGRSWFLLILILCTQLSAKHNKCVTSQVRSQEVALFSFSHISAKSLLDSCSTSFMAMPTRGQGELRNVWSRRGRKMGCSILFTVAQTLTSSHSQIPSKCYFVFAWLPDCGNKVMLWAALRRPSGHGLASCTGEHFSSPSNTHIFHFGHKCASSFYLQIALGSGNNCELAWLWLQSCIRPEEWKDNESFTIVLWVAANNLGFWILQLF